ncbi:hypothetical protein L210DRAFT_438448 [Boletus edulis BED1]|uniref:Uncharacterized protein n=1 Tax=Boletus edulis BED1 TaxID=1328754 RepID=A0AAD4BWQ3_BOLED|nr:hypothetical protein L210DRAFT_438448 [Boletus edulis BED1]
MSVSPIVYVVLVYRTLSTTSSCILYRTSNVNTTTKHNCVASFAPPPALAGSSSSAARARVFTHPPHPGRPPWRSDSSSLSTGSHRTLAWCARCSHPPSQLTIGPGQFVEPDSALRCRPSPLPFRHSRLRLCHLSSRFTSAVQRPTNLRLYQRWSGPGQAFLQYDAGEKWNTYSSKSRSPPFDSSRHSACSASPGCCYYLRPLTLTRNGDFSIPVCGSMHL